MKTRRSLTGWSVVACTVLFVGVVAGPVTARADQFRAGERVEHRLEHRGDRVDRRLDRRGERIDRRLDRRGERVEHRFGRRAGRAAANGHERREFRERQRQRLRSRGGAEGIRARPIRPRER